MTVLAILLQSSATKSSSGAQFAEVFTLMLIGSIAVTVRANLCSRSNNFLSFSRLAQFSAVGRKNLLFSIGLRSRLLPFTTPNRSIREQLSSLRLESIHLENSAHPSFCRRDVRLRLDDVRQRWFLRSNSTSESSSFGPLPDLFILLSRCLADHSSCSSKINRSSFHRRSWRQKGISMNYSFSSARIRREQTDHYYGNQSSLRSAAKSPVDPEKKKRFVYPFSFRIFSQIFQQTTYHQRARTSSYFEDWMKKEKREANWLSTQLSLGTCVCVSTHREQEKRKT